LDLKDRTKDSYILLIDLGSMESVEQTRLISITQKAAEKIVEFMKQENKEKLYLRVYVSGGGCSGLSYGMGFEEKPDEDDAIINENGVEVIVDSYSQKYLKGANVDYVESLMGSGFKINNPNVTKSCSCGHSFSTD
jgi:iron-sulfur cluster assembly accessory protein